MKKKMASMITSKNSHLITRTKMLTDNELMIYQQQKRIKDFEFYSAVTPYVSTFFVCVSISIFIFLHINQKYSKKGISLLDKLKYNLLDIKEE